MLLVINWKGASFWFFFSSYWAWMSNKYTSMTNLNRYHWPVTLKKQFLFQRCWQAWRLLFMQYGIKIFSKLLNWGWLRTSDAGSLSGRHHCIPYNGLRWAYKDHKWLTRHPDYEATWFCKILINDIIFGNGSCNIAFTYSLSKDQDNDNNMLAWREIEQTCQITCICTAILSTALWIWYGRARTWPITYIFIKPFTKPLVIFERNSRKFSNITIILPLENLCFFVLNRQCSQLSNPIFLKLFGFSPCM